MENERPSPPPGCAATILFAVCAILIVVLFPILNGMGVPWLAILIPGGMIVIAALLLNRR